MSNLLYLEDFHEGQIFEWGHLIVTEDEIVDFGRRFDPVPIHTDIASAERSIFGGLIASGWHVAALMQRMQSECYLQKSAVIASPGVDEIKWLCPVRPDDTLSLHVEVTEARRSRTRPDRGLVRVTASVINQNGETVMTKQGKTFIRCRQAFDPSEPE